MTTKTYQGSCICKAIRFAVELDLQTGTTKCNCTICWKRRWWGATVQPQAFRLLSAPAELGYGFPTESYGTRAVCRECGVAPFAWGNGEWVGGDYVSLQLSCLDDLEPAELCAAPVRYLDGLHDNWWAVPAETRHL